MGRRARSAHALQGAGEVWGGRGARARAVSPCAEAAEVAISWCGDKVVGAWVLVCRPGFDWPAGPTWTPFLLAWQLLCTAVRTAHVFQSGVQVKS